MPVAKQYYYFKDFRQHRGYTWCYVNSAADGLALVAPLSALLSAGFDGARGLYTIPQIPGVIGSPSYYRTVYDKARIGIADGQGDVHYFDLPAPLVSIFELDVETVDLQNAAVQTWLTAMLAHAKGVAGQALTTWRGGQRVSRQPHRYNHV